MKHMSSRTLCVLAFLFLQWSTTVQAVSFGTNGIVTTNIMAVPGEDIAYAVTQDSSGRFIVAGESSDDVFVMRFDADGNLDTTFNDDGIITLDVAESSEDMATAIKVDSSGRILVAGFSNGSYYQGFILRLTESGALDTSFSDDGLLAFSYMADLENFPQDIDVDSAGLIYVAGMTNYIGQYDVGIARITDAGELDTTFGTNGIVTIDTSSGLSDAAYAVKLASDGSVFIAGVTDMDGAADAFVAKLDSSGNLSTTFGGGDGFVTFTMDGNDIAFDILIASTGKIYAGGMSGTSSATTDFALARLTSSGFLDTTYGGGDGFVTTDFSGSGRECIVALQSVSTSVVAYGISEGSSGTIAMAKYNRFGVLDTTFGGGDGTISTTASGLENANCYYNKLAIRPLTGSVVVGSSAGAVNDDAALAVFDIDANLDTAFSDDGMALSDVTSDSEDNLSATTRDAQGRIIAVGYASNGSDTDLALVRYDTEGTLDTTFGDDGIVTLNVATGSSDQAYDVVIDSAGLITVAGRTGTTSDSSYQFLLTRFQDDGDIDTSFGGGDGIVMTDIGTGGDVAYAIAMDSAGRIYIGGYTYSTETDFAIARYDATGALDTTYGGGDGILITDIDGSDTIRDLHFDSQDRLIAAGYNSSSGSGIDFALVRYDSAGAPDATFGGGDGIVTLNSGAAAFDYAFAVTTDNADRILIAGAQESGVGTYYWTVVRYDTTGNLESSFASGGIYHEELNFANVFAVQDILIDSAGRILTAGSDSTDGSNYDFVLKRLTDAGALDTSFGDGDGTIRQDIGSYDTPTSAVLDDSNRVILAGYADADFALAAISNTVCGDNVTDTGETCDDGNTADGDSCPATCIEETVPVTDADADGVTESDCANAADDDGDGTTDCADFDCAANASCSAADADGDGTTDAVDTDDDNDGTADADDTDDDGDGTDDAQDDSGDSDGDGTTDALDTDDDNDGTADADDTDDDGDGISDAQDDTVDSDGDGTPDANDTDDDNDGTLDSADSDQAYGENNGNTGGGGGGGCTLASDDAVSPAAPILIALGLIVMAALRMKRRVA